MGNGLLFPAKRNHWVPDDFPSETDGIHLIRIVGGDRLRSYTPMTVSDGAAGIAQTFNQLFIHSDRIDDEGAYGIVDILAGEDIVAEVGIAKSRDFQNLVKRIGCRVDSTDGDPID